MEITTFVAGFNLILALFLSFLAIRAYVRTGERRAASLLISILGLAITAVGLIVFSWHNPENWGILLASIGEAVTLLGIYFATFG